MTRLFRALKVAEQSLPELSESIPEEKFIHALSDSGSSGSLSHEAVTHSILLYLWLLQ